MDDTKRYFKEGDEVAHKDNIITKLEVRKVVRTTKEGKSFTIGIECGWWDGETYVKERFHSAKLVPWDIAAQGHHMVVRWIETRNNIKV